MSNVLQVATLAVLVVGSPKARGQSRPRIGDSVELARSPGATCDLKDDERFLYWTTVDFSFGRRGARTAGKRAGGRVIDWRYERATIQRLPKAGGIPQTLIEVKGDRLSNLDLDENHLYWNGQRRNDVWRAAKEGGRPVRLDDGERPVFGTVHDSEYLYVRDQSAPPRGVLRIPIGGGRTEVVVPSKAFSVVLGVDQGLLYWSERVGDSLSDVWTLKVGRSQGGRAHSYDRRRRRVTYEHRL